MNPPLHYKIHLIEEDLETRVKHHFKKDWRLYVRINLDIIDRNDGSYSS